MKLYKFFYLPCVLLCLYGLYILVADSYKVIYQETDEMSPIQFLACVELRYLFPNQTEFDLNELRNELYDHFNSSKYFRFGRKLQRRTFELILERTRSGDYLILNRRVCFNVNEQKELQDIDLFLSNRKVMFAIQRETFDFVRLKHPSHSIEQLIVRKKGRPYSDCDKGNGRFHCLNECFRRHFRLSRYFYYGNETGSILLQFSESNQTIQESERICFSKCKRENCKLVQLIVAGDLNKSKTVEAQPVLSAFDFWFRLIGPIISFVNFLFSQFASITTEFIRSRVRRKKVKIGLFPLNLVMIFLSLAYFIYLWLTLDWQAEMNQLPEIKMTRNLIQQRVVHLAICVDVEMYGDFDYGYEGKTMSEIEKQATILALDDALGSIYASDGGRSFPIDWFIHPKILFKDERSFSRCFRLSVHLNYTMIPFQPKLTIEFKNDGFRSQIYLLSEEENLNSKSFEYNGRYAFQKRTVKRLNLNESCVDYKVKYANCTGRQNCVERCISRKFVERYNRTTFGSHLIDRDWFSASEWNTLELMRISLNDRSLYQAAYLNASWECEKEIPRETPCNEISFERTVGIPPAGDRTVEIDLQFDILRSVEEIPPSLLMSLLSIQSIFFGFTILQLFWLIYQLIRLKWRMRNDKIIWFLICLLALIGCSWKTIGIFNVIVNGELVPTQHYEIAQRVKMPMIVFCFRIDQNLVDKDHKLTGKYLENVTTEMNVESTFKSIAYLNKSNEWTSLDLILVERFFLLDMKCFRINTDQEYSGDQFHFSDDTQVLRVNFRKMKEKRIVHFMTQSRKTEEFSKILNLDYSLDFKYSITHEAFLYEYEDRFSFLRSHFPSLQKGDVISLREQLLELQGSEPNRRTLNLPLEEKHSDLDVDEKHFEHLYLTKNLMNRTKLNNLNQQQKFVTNHFRSSLSSGSDFSFNIVFHRKIVSSTNQMNYPTLILAFFNLLFILFELAPIDLRFSSIFSSIFSKRSSRVCLSVAND